MTNEATTNIEESTAADNSIDQGSAAPDSPAADKIEAADATPAVSDETTAAPAEQAASEPTLEPAPESAPEPAPAEPVAAAEPVATVEKEAAPAKEIDFGAILEQFEQEQTIFHPGELVEGKVVGISDRGVMIDFGYKSEGYAPVEDFTDADGNMTVNVGDEVKVVLRTMHSGDTPPQLSLMDAEARVSWDVLEKAFTDEAIVIGTVVDKTKGGLRVNVNGIEAFLPGSQIDSRPIHNLDQYKGQEIEAKIIKFSRRRNNVVLSRKVLTDEVVDKLKAETMSQIDVGYVVEGTIKNLTEYGAFVDMGGIDGLLHVTDMSWGRLHHPGDMFKVGDHIQVKILKLDREKEKISLGYKQLQPDPWSTVIEVYPVNTQLKGKVSSVTDYGVFVELEPGVEGLVHVSEISWSRRSQSPKRMFNRNDEVEVQVLGVDTVERRISLGMKQFQDNPWDTVDTRYPIGTKIHGRVRNITDFGAFVELEAGIDGLVHVSDITWTKKIKHPKDVLKKDQEVDAIVTSIDKQGQRLSLSMKDLTPSAWEGFIATHRPGDVVRGKVSRFTNFGIFIELGEGLEGLCHISELSDERVERAESVAELGQEMDFKILRIEQADQKIGLSHRAVGKEDEPVVDTKIYSSVAKGGMASLGELANLKFGSSEEAPEEAPKEKKSKKERKAEAEAAKAEASSLAHDTAPDGADEVAGDGAKSAEVSEKAGEGVQASALESIDESADEKAISEPSSEEAPTIEGGELEAKAGEPEAEPAATVDDNVAAEQAEAEPAVEAAEPEPKAEAAEPKTKPAAEIDDKASVEEADPDPEPAADTSTEETPAGETVDTGPAADETAVVESTDDKTDDEESETQTA